MINGGHTSPRSSAALRLAELYLDIKDYLIQAGFSAEIDWQHGRSIQRLTESQFLRESAWVVLSSGFRESVLRPKFQALSKAFEWWSSASRITSVRKSCRRRALGVFGNESKIDAILAIADRVGVIGFQDVRMRLQREGIDFIRTFPFMGPVTSFHLAKNVGIQVSKPDRHLVRISRVLGFRSVASVCDLIGRVVGDPVSVVDLVFWRYATLQPDYRAQLTHALKRAS